MTLLTSQCRIQLELFSLIRWETFLEHFNFLAAPDCEEPKRVIGGVCHLFI